MVFDPSELDSAVVINDAIANVLHIIKDSWGLDKPEDCRIYVMKSWWGFTFQSAPWVWRIFLAITFPLWCFRAQRMWSCSAAWTQRLNFSIPFKVF